MAKMRYALAELIRRARLNTWGKSFPTKEHEILFIADWLIENGVVIKSAADVAEIVMCKDCIHAIEHKYSPAFFKCDGCSFLRGRLVSSTFWCKCGERKPSE